MGLYLKLDQRALRELRACQNNKCIAPRYQAVPGDVQLAAPAA